MIRLDNPKLLATTMIADFKKNVVDQNTPAKGPSYIERFQNQVKSVYFPEQKGLTNEQALESLRGNEAFGQYPHLKAVIETVLSFDPAMQPEQALAQLTAISYRDWEASDSQEQFENLQKHYGFWFVDEQAQALFSTLAQRCRVMAVLFEKNNTPEDTMAYEYAYKLMALFLEPGKEIDVEEDFASIAQKGQNLLTKKLDTPVNKPLHDLLLLSNLPMKDDVSDISGWQALIENEGAKVLPYFTDAQRIEAKLAEETAKAQEAQEPELQRQAPKSLKEARKILALCQYQRASEDPELAEICSAAMIKVDEATFNRCLDYLYTTKLSAVEGWPKKAVGSDSIPDLVVEGCEAAEGLYWVKLPADDKRALILGKMTGCCQSIGDHSECCVIDACERSDNALYVLLKSQNKKTGKDKIFSKDKKINYQDFKIVGQSYVWRSELGNICLDSIEFLGNQVSTEALRSILEDFGQATMESDPKAHFVTVGAGGQTPEKLFPAAKVAEKMRQGRAYGDAWSQYTVTQRYPTPEIHGGVMSKRTRDALEHLSAHFEQEGGVIELADFFPQDEHKNENLESTGGTQAHIEHLMEKMRLVGVFCNERGKISDFQKIEITQKLDRLTTAQLMAHWTQKEHLAEIVTRLAPEKVEDYLKLEFILAVHFDDEQRIKALIELSCARSSDPQRKTVLEAACARDSLSKRDLTQYSTRQLLEGWIKKENLAQALVQLGPDNIHVYRTREMVQALESYDVELVRALIELGCDPNIQIGEKSALAKAYSQNHDEILKILIDSGADVAEHPSVNEIFVKVVEAGYTDTVELLLKKYANEIDLNAQESNGEYPLFCALHCGQVETAKVLIEYGANIEISIGADKETPLMWACRSSQTEFVDYLLSKGANVYTANALKTTPMMLACLKGDTEIVSILLKHEPNIINASNWSLTPLTCACLYSYHELVKLLLNKGANSDLADKDGDTPLIIACKKNQREIAQLLIQAGCHIDVQDDYGNTGLMRACEYGHTEIVSLFLSSNAHLNIANNQGNTALILALKNRRVEIAELLIKSGADINAINDNGGTALTRACQSGLTKVVEILLEKGVKLNTQTKAGDTPLMTALKNRRVEIAKLLIKSGAEMNLPDKDGKTILMWACEKGHVDTMRLLVSSGININATDKSRRTPLMIARKNAHIDIVNFLIENGADINAKDPYDHTLLMWACLNGHLETVKLLMEKGVDIEQEDTFGWTPLLSACKKGHADIARILIDQGANVNAADCDGYTPLISACESGNMEIARILIEQGADLNLADSESNTPLMWACRNEHGELVEKLILAGAKVEEAMLDSSSNIPSSMIELIKEKMREVVPTTEQVEAQEDSVSSAELTEHVFPQSFFGSQASQHRSQNNNHHR